MSSMYEIEVTVLFLYQQSWYSAFDFLQHLVTGGKIKELVSDRNWGIYTVKWNIADPSGHMVQGVGLQPLACWEV